MHTRKFSPTPAAKRLVITTRIFTGLTHLMVEWVKTVLRKQITAEQARTILFNCKIYEDESSFSALDHSKFHERFMREIEKFVRMDDDKVEALLKVLRAVNAFTCFIEGEDQFAFRLAGGEVEFLTRGAMTAGGKVVGDPDYGSFRINPVIKKAVDPDETTDTQGGIEYSITLEGMLDGDPPHAWWQSAVQRSGVDLLTLIGVCWENYRAQIPGPHLLGDVLKDPESFRLRETDINRCTILARDWLRQIDYSTFFTLVESASFVASGGASTRSENPQEVHWAHRTLDQATLGSSVVSGILHQVVQEVISLGADRDVYLAGLPRRYVGSLAVLRTPSDQVNMDLHELNRVPILTGFDTPPLGHVLMNLRARFGLQLRPDSAILRVLEYMQGRRNQL